jgi:hypothetical protein
VKTDEEEYGRRLLTPLREEQETPLGPSTIDVAAVVARGRRRVRVRRVVGAGCAVAVVAAVMTTVPVGAAMLRDRSLPAPAGPAATPAAPSPSPSGPAPPTACSVRRLAPDLDGAAATGVDPTGRQVLGRVRAGGSARHLGLIWKNGTMDKVEIPGTDQAITAANAAGAAIAVGYVNGDRRGWVFVDGKIERLLAKTPTIPQAIAEDGTVVGYRFAGPDESLSFPVIWRVPRAGSEDLPLPPAVRFGRAVDIGPDGTVLGAVTDGPYERSRGYLWRPDGTLSQLPLPEIDGKPASGFMPLALGERWITGYAFPALAMDVTDPHGVKGAEEAKQADARGAMGKPGTVPPLRLAPVPALYDRTTGRFRLFPDVQMIIESGNARGWVVGQTFDGKPMLLSETGPLRLPTLNDLDDHVATGLSDDGRVIVGHAWRGGRTYALVWSCR